MVIFLQDAYFIIMLQKAEYILHVFQQINNTKKVKTPQTHNYQHLKTKKDPPKVDLNLSNLVTLGGN
ncbi:hypothetical protein SAMN04489761_1330 [Tenacibaculum sp. MAR_2009_124]|nr:hypothetical protein SAMN04489761_1330 [Tenacibaculum sp. MAR_2009_124]